MIIFMIVLFCILWAILFMFLIDLSYKVEMNQILLKHIKDMLRIKKI
jgi:hypothetical protein